MTFKIFKMHHNYSSNYHKCKYVFNVRTFFFIIIIFQYICSVHVAKCNITHNLILVNKLGIFYKEGLAGFTCIHWLGGGVRSYMDG